MARLQDGDTVVELHREVWSRPAARLARWWQPAIRHYNVITAAPLTVSHRQG